jgi:hypothetical protein
LPEVCWHGAATPQEEYGRAALGHFGVRRHHIYLSAIASSLKRLRSSENVSAWSIQTSRFTAKLMAGCLMLRKLSKGVGEHILRGGALQPMALDLFGGSLNVEQWFVIERRPLRSKKLDLESTQADSRARFFSENILNQAFC